MNRNLKRHNLIVARRNTDELADVEFIPIEGFVQPIKPEVIAQYSQSGASEQKWIKVFTSRDIPQAFRIGTTSVRPDYVYWEGNYYRCVIENDWVKMGRDTYFERQCYYSSSDSDAPTDDVPDFENEYYPFVNSVAQLGMVVDLSLEPLKEQINECMNKEA